MHLLRQLRQRARLLTLAGSLCALGAAAHASAQLSGFAMSPMEVRTLGAVGRSGVMEFEVENFEGRPLSVTVKIQSMKPEDGSYRRQLDVPHKWDCSSWFTRNNFSLTLAPARREPLKLNYRVPNVPPGAYWCVANVEPVFPGVKHQILLKYQVPILIYVGRQPRPDLVFESPELTVNREQSVAGVPIRNKSATTISVATTVELRDARTRRLLQRQQDVDRDIYSESYRVLPIPLVRVPDGQYIVQAQVRAGVRNFRPISRSFIVENGKARPLTEAEALALPQVAFDPGGFSQDVPAGGRRTIGFSLVNTSNVPQTVDLSARVVEQLQDGSYTLPEGKQPEDLTVSVTPTTLTLQPRARAGVRMVVEVGKDAKGDLWFGLVATPRDGKSMPEEVRGRVVVPKTQDAKLAMKSKRVVLNNGIPQSVEFEITNTGNTALMPIYSGAILKDGIRQIMTAEVPVPGDGGLLPGATLANSVTIPPGVPPGKYYLTVMARYGDALSERLAVEFTIPQPKKPAVKPPAKAGSKPPPKTTAKKGKGRGGAPR